MKAFLLLIALTFNTWAQDPQATLKAFDNKIYSLKNKGVSDLVFEVSPESLTKQLNEEMIYGHLNDVRFKVYWTSNPERIAIEVLGLPEGFKEVKEELKARISTQLGVVLPIPTAQRFTGYKIIQGKTPREVVAQDTSGVATIPKFFINFDAKDKIESIVADKFVGTMKTTYSYERESYSDGRWVYRGEKLESTEAGSKIIVAKNVNYSGVNGIQVPTKVRVTTEQQSLADSKSMKSEEVVNFENYKINTGAALKFFLGESAQKTP